MPLPALPTITLSDTVTPATQFGDLFYSNDAILSFSTADATVTRSYEVYRNNVLVYSGAATPPDAAFKTTEGAYIEGTYSIRVTDTNIVPDPTTGNTRTGFLDFVLDTTAPAAPVIALANNSGVVNDLITNDPTLAAPPANVSGITVQYALNPTGGSGELVWRTLADINTILATLPDGAVTVRARQSDRAGNVGPESSITFTVDKTAPDALILTATGNDEEVTISPLPADTSALYSYRLFGSTEWSAPTPTAPTGLANGVYEIRVVAIDIAGNESAESPLSIAVVTVDNIAAPTVVLNTDSGIATDKITNNEALIVTPTEGLTTEFSYDNGATWLTEQRTDLADGVYTVKVRQSNLAGDEVSPEATISFTLDTVVAALAPAATMNVATFLTVSTFAGRETGSVIEWSTDGGVNWSTTKPTTSLDDGDIITLRQTDLAGNISANASITIDIPDVVTPPVVQPPVVVGPPVETTRYSDPIHETNLGGLF